MSYKTKEAPHWHIINLKKPAPPGTMKATAIGPSTPMTFIGDKQFVDAICIAAPNGKMFEICDDPTTQQIMFEIYKLLDELNDDDDEISTIATIDIEQRIEAIQKFI